MWHYQLVEVHIVGFSFCFCSVHFCERLISWCIHSTRTFFCVPHNIHRGMSTVNRIVGECLQLTESWLTTPEPSFLCSAYCGVWQRGYPLVGVYNTLNTKTQCWCVRVDIGRGLGGRLTIGWLTIGWLYAQHGNVGFRFPLIIITE